LGAGETKDGSMERGGKKVKADFVVTIAITKALFPCFFTRSPVLSTTK
jgi:hypothetical protein